MDQIAPRVYLEDGFLGATLGVISLQMGTIMIDSPPCPDEARSWRATLRNVNSGVNRLLITLDEHYDRTLGSRAMDCPVLAHFETAESFRDRATVFKGQSLDSGADWEECIGLSGIRWSLPHITFDRQAFLHWDDVPLIVEHHPGPAPGAVWVEIPEEKIIFTGDASPIDQPPFLENADISTWIDSLDVLLSSRFKDYTIISGRGGPTTSENIRDQKQQLRYIDSRLKRLANRDASPEDTEALVDKLLSNLTFPREYYEKYYKRLSYGLYHYYLQQYCPEELIPKE